MNTTTDYTLNYTFGAAPAEVGSETALKGNGTTDAAVQYINATTTADAADFEESTIRVAVSKAAIATQNATPENVTIYHKSDQGYTQIETTRLFETVQGHVYEVTTESYSIFAVGIQSTTEDETDGEDGTEGDDGAEDDDRTGDGSSGGGGSGGGGGGGGGGVPPSATDGTGVEVTNISEELGDNATIVTTYEAIMFGEPNSKTANFPDTVPLQSVAFETEQFDEIAQRTVNTREISGIPQRTGAPQGTVVTMSHLTMPNATTADQVTVKYNISEQQIDDLGKADPELTLTRFADGEWRALDTTTSSTENAGVIVTTDLANATSTYYAVTAPAIEDDEEPADPTGDDATEPPSDDATPGFGLGVTVVAMIALIIGMLAWRNRA